MMLITERVARFFYRKWSDRMPFPNGLGKKESKIFHPRMDAVPVPILFLWPGAFSL
jgi:hypothetical protein